MRMFLGVPRACGKGMNGVPGGMLGLVHLVTGWGAEAETSKQADI